MVYPVQKRFQFTDDDMVSMRIYILSTFINHAVVDTIQPKLMDVQSLVDDKTDAGFIDTYENMKSCHQVHRPIKKEDIDGTDDDVVIVVNNKLSKVIVVKYSDDDMVWYYLITLCSQSIQHVLFYLLVRQNII